MTTPDLIVTEATVLTLDDAPEADTEVEAVAFAHGRVLELGSSRRIEALAGPSTEVLRGADGYVVPGFVDCHTHAARLGELHFRADLARATDREEVVHVLQERAQRTPAGGWVIGWNWDESGWPDGQPLTPDDLDRVSGEHPVMARRVCGHKAIINQAAVSALGPELSDVVGVERAQGGPTGLLTEDAADAAWEACAPSHETCLQGLAVESQRLASLGITTIADTAGPRDVRLLVQGTAEGPFLQRAGLYLREELLKHAEALSLGPIGGTRCALLGVKTYTDGSIGARTAAVSEPYADEPGAAEAGKATGAGTLLRDAKQVEALARRTTKLGLQLKAHAIGDVAITAVLDGLDAAEVPATLRPRIEHAELLHEDHLAEMARLGVTAVLQPNFIGNWQGPDGLYERRLGKARTARMNPLRSVLDAGVPLAFSSDGMPYGPLYGMQCALEHPSPRERLTGDEALYAYTRAAARALGMEDRIGVLRPGAAGDAVVLAEDPRTSSKLADIDVVGTVIGGRVVA